MESLSDDAGIECVFLQILAQQCSKLHAYAIGGMAYVIDRKLFCNRQQRVE